MRESGLNALDAAAGEFHRYRSIAEKAIAQLDEECLNKVLAPETNSVANLIRHLSGNLQSRFTNFLTEDGEKPWRDRDSEFVGVFSKNELMAMWNEAWRTLDDTLDNLSVDQLERTVEIRKIPLSVQEALSRSSAHVAYHVGQIVLLARLMSTEGKWEWISIPKGASASYNANPDKEKKP